MDLLVIYLLMIQYKAIARTLLISTVILIHKKSILLVYIQMKRLKLIIKVEI